MRFILTLLMTSVLAFGLSCQKNASSSSIETRNENPVAKNTADIKASETKANSEEQGHEHEGDAPRISLADAKKDFDAGDVVFIDTRAENSFDNEHIKGALNFPVNQFEKDYNKLPKDKKIIAYCS